MKPIVRNATEKSAGSLSIRRAGERGRSNLGWLDSRHTFSFSDYYDPQYMGFRSLRVINDDRVAAARGFGTHGHQDMEIISYVLDGALAHKDSLGTGSIIKPGDVQRMSAGTGIRHSELNPSQTEPVRFLQIWIEPEVRGIEPSYEQRSYPEADRAHQLCLVASRDGRDGSVTIHQDVLLFSGILSDGDRVEYRVESGRHAWIQVARGRVAVNGEQLDEGDGVNVSGYADLVLTGSGPQPAEVLLFDLA